MKNYSFIQHYYYQKSDLCLKFGSKLTNQICLFGLGQMCVQTLKKNDKIFFRVDMVLLFYTMFSVVPTYSKVSQISSVDKIKEGYQLQVSFKKLDIYKLLWYIFCEKDSKLHFSVQLLKKYDFFDYVIVNLKTTLYGSIIDYAHITSYRNFIKCDFSLLLHIITNELDKKSKYFIDFIKHLMYLWEL